MNALATLTIILNLIPAIITAIKAIEDAIPASGAGKEKLAALRQIIETAYGQSLTIWPILEKTISTLVELMNKTGSFKK